MNWILLVYFNFNQDKFIEYEKQIGQKLSNFFKNNVVPDLLIIKNHFFIFI